MAKEEMKSGLKITRQPMIQLLNEDLAGEYQAIIAYTVYSQVLKGAAYTDIARVLEAHAGEELAHAIKIAKQVDYLGSMPGVMPKPVKTSTDPVAMLRAYPSGRGDGGICVERDLARNYRAGAGARNRSGCGAGHRRASRKGARRQKNGL